MIDKKLVLSLTRLSFPLVRFRHNQGSNDNRATWQFIPNYIFSLPFIAQHVIDKKLVLSLTRLSFPLVHGQPWKRGCHNTWWRIFVCRCLSSNKAWPSKLTVYRVIELVWGVKCDHTWWHTRPGSLVEELMMNHSIQSATWPFVHNSCNTWQYTRQ